LAGAGLLQGEPGKQRLLLSVVDPAKVQQLLEKLFDGEEFLSPHGLRSLSLFHRARPYELQTGALRSSVDYEPAESTTPMFGGNSNWRGPVWFPLNYLVVTALEQYHWFFGEELEIEYPTRSGQRMSLDKIANDIQRRLISIFLPGPDGRRPCFGAMDLFQHDNAWKDNLWFNEYFHGDNGRGSAPPTRQAGPASWPTPSAGATRPSLSSGTCCEAPVGPPERQPGQKHQQQCKKAQWLD
jgi:Glycosyl hydrolase family 63 C-terminal domain